MFFDQPKKDIRPNERIITLVLNTFRYTPSFKAGKEMTTERSAYLSDPNKDEKVTDDELGYLKSRIANHFREKINALKDNENFLPSDLIKGIETLIDGFKKESRKIRTYKGSKELSHSDGRLEKYFDDVVNALEKIKSDYDIYSLLQDINFQKKDIQKNGEYYQNKWKDPQSRYPQKYAVLTAVENYLHQKIDIDALSKIVDENSKYDSGKKIGRSKTGQLLDRALLFRGESLRPSQQHKL